MAMVQIPVSVKNAAGSLIQQVVSSSLTIGSPEKPNQTRKMKAPVIATGAFLATFQPNDFSPLFVHSKDGVDPVSGLPLQGLSRDGRQRNAQLGVPTLRFE